MKSTAYKIEYPKNIYEAWPLDTDKSVGIAWESGGAGWRKPKGENLGQLS